MKIDSKIRDANEAMYRKIWESKNTKQIKKEISGWRKYMQKHAGSYGWIEINPNELNDSDKLNILREILKKRGESC